MFCNSGSTTVTVYVQDGTELISCWTVGGSTTELVCKGYEAQCNVDGFAIAIESIKHGQDLLKVLEEQYGVTCTFG